MKTRKLLQGLMGLTNRYLSRRRRSVSDTQVEQMCLEALEGRVLYSATLELATATDLTTSTAVLASPFASLEDTREAHDWFGAAQATGDFNDDGYDDLAVGVPREDINGKTNAGAVQVIYGGPGGLSVFGDQLWTQSDLAGSNSETGDQFGYSLAVGDFNKDGIDDLAVGSPYEDGGSANSVGGVHVILGSPSKLTATGSTFWTQKRVGQTNQAGDLFGFSLAAGDFNGDGRDELVVGSPKEDLGPDTNAGMIHVIRFDGNFHQNFSQPFMSGPAEIIFADSGDQFGYALAVGDFDDDGRDDLAISAPFEDFNGRTNAGVVHAMYGTANGLNAVGAETWTQAMVGGAVESHDWFGYSLAAGHFDNDIVAVQGPSGPVFTFSTPDSLVVGVPREDFSFGGVARTDAGVVHVIHGSKTFDGLTSVGNQIFHQGMLTGTNPENYDQFGRTLAVGDFDGGLDDLVVGSPFEDYSGNNAGVLHVIYSEKPGFGFATDGLSTAGNQIWHEDRIGIPDDTEAGDQFARSLAAGDFNGDGYDELAVGVPFEDFTEVSNSLTNAGAVQVINGSVNKLSGSGGWWYQGKGLSFTLTALVAELDESDSIF